ncbi:MAG: peptidase dimerization domain-containing protein [Clostridia bacterium]|nr:peptidase dimerization domain-containing protein [Clostridia bacterium]MBQ2326918.1 peptidase dimerization domain-containing protein [Clostridia bacterium]
MTVQEMKKAVCEAIDNHAQELIELTESIFNEPELGYKEFKTAGKVKAHLDKLGLKYKDGVAITGIVTPVEGRDHKAKIAIMGELDAVVVPNHPTADPVTHAAHCCGHNAQAASVVGVAYGLMESGVMQHLDGDVVLMHVPSEEFVELEYRKSLIDEGKVSFLGGKQEFIKLGVFDDIDMMFMQHTWNTEDGEGSKIKAFAGLGGGMKGMGFVGRLIQYLGKESHAAMPSQGVNALKAAQLGLQMVDANRETFLDDDNIRVHPIITKGGDLVNVVPADVRLETYVRGNNTEAILAAAAKVDRAFKAGADALGAQCIITHLPGYMCPTESVELKDVIYENLKLVYGDEHVIRDGMGGSTDASDVAHIIPSVHMMVGGSRGVGHGADYEICRPDLAVVDAAKAMACTAIDLLVNGAEKALEVKAAYKAPLTKEEYLKTWGGLNI